MVVAKGKKCLEESPWETPGSRLSGAVIANREHVTPSAVFFCMQLTQPAVLFLLKRAALKLNDVRWPYSFFENQQYDVLGVVPVVVK